MDIDDLTNPVPVMPANVEVELEVGSPTIFHAAEPYTQPTAVITEIPVVLIEQNIVPESLNTVIADPSNIEIKVNDAPNEPDNEFSFASPEPHNNATQEIAIGDKLADGWDELATTLVIPADTAARTMNYLEQVPAGDMDNGDGLENWSRVVGAGLKHNSLHDNMQPATNRKGADYRQRIMAGDRALSIARPRIKDDDSPLLSGERGVLRIKALLGQGSIIQVPMWHSGFWLTLKAPGEVDLLDAYQRIIDNKIVMGRYTNGLAFANHSVYDNAVIVDLAMKCLYETSVQGLNAIADIRSLIKAPDIHLLAWGLACAIWPRGFQYERSILDAKGQSTVTVRENLNVGSLLWVDQSSLNSWQIAHMAKRQTGSMSRESLKTYNEHFVRGQSKAISLNDDIIVTGRVPSIEDYLTSGQLWIDELVASVNNAFTEETDTKRRNELIHDRAKATSMRQYAHWIESFDIPSLDKKMIGRDELERTCTELSSDDILRDKYYAVMKEYINDSTIALIAVPQTHPSETSEVLPRFENLIPLDPISVFFTLLFQKIAQIKARP